MNKYIIGTPEQIAQYRKAFDRLEDLPRKGTTVGSATYKWEPGEYKHGNCPGWTAETLEEPTVMVLAVVRVSEDVQHHLGKTTTYYSQEITLPPSSELVTESDLPKPFRDYIESRRAGPAP